MLWLVVSIVEVSWLPRHCRSLVMVAVTVVKTIDARRPELSAPAASPPSHRR